MTQVTGIIKAIKVKKADFRVVHVRQKDGSIAIAAGNLADFQEGETVVMHGDWAEWENKRTGEKVNQFKVEAAFRPRPRSPESLEKLLAKMPGCGPSRAGLLVKKFGADLFGILDDGELKELIKVKGIGETTATRILRSWRDNSLDLYIGEFLASIDVNPKWARRIRYDLGADAVNVIQKNPYRLISVTGIGFKKADEIASRLGWTADSPERAEAVLSYLLEEAGNEGHSFLPRNGDTQTGLVQKAMKECFVGEKLINEVLDKCYEKKTLVKEVANTTAGPVELVYLPRLYNAEVRLARKLRILLENKPFCRFSAAELDWMVKSREQALGVELTDEQRTAIVNAFTQPVSILTGGPGTGKTTLVKVLVEVARLTGHTLSLCAPTGRAAKHLSNVTGEPALTIHRLLKYDADKNQWSKNENDQLDTGMVIADEFSMVDVDLAYRLFDAVKPGTPVLVIGDKDQLPAVSPGKVLEDLIASKKIPVTRLTKIFRQAESSLIVQNAHRILRGETLLFPAKKNGAELADSYLMEPPEIPAVDEKGKIKLDKNKKPKRTEDTDWIKSRILHMCRVRIPERLQLNPIRDVQVLTPMKKGTCGVHELNIVLQDALNPLPEGIDPDADSAFQVILGDRKFRVGDRVLQTRNNYGLEIYNGDIGFVMKVDHDEGRLHVDFDGSGDPQKYTEYPYEDAKADLQLGYVLTVHKCVAKGSKVPVSGKGLVPIEDVQTGDWVQTGFGYKQVLNTACAGEKPVVTVRTRSGYSIDVSEEHPILVADEKGTAYIRAADLKTGMYACIDRSLATGTGVLLPALDYTESALPGTFKPKKLDIPHVLTPGMAWAIGVILGDGSMTDRDDGTIEITSQDQEVLTPYRRLFESMSLTVTERVKEGNAAKQMYWTSKPLRGMLASLGLDYVTARNKKIPDLFFRLDHYSRACLLRGLFDTDGSAGNGAGKLCRFATASRRLALDVQTMLLSLGVVSYLRYLEASDSWHVCISGTGLKPFAEHVGFSIKYKHDRLQELLDHNHGKTNNDHVPFGKALVETLKRAFPRTYCVKGIGRFGPNSSRIGALLSRIKRGTSRLSYGHLRSVCETLSGNDKAVTKQIEEVLENHHFFDPIVAIDRPGTLVPMYDLEMDDKHSFVANGFICHNSQGGEFPVVIQLLLRSNHMMLQRNLVYTAVTRAKQLLVFMGNRWVIEKAVNNVTIHQRNSFLAMRLRRETEAAKATV
jgi:exodeoxyribonuclease V alpha subunit